MTRDRPLVTKLIDNRFTRRIRPRVDRLLIKRDFGLAMFSHYARVLAPAGRAALFNQSGASALPGIRFARPEWLVEDDVSRYRLPLRSEHAAFDWSAALGALGHDAGVKAIYRELTIDAKRRGERVRFFDIGANFGWHSFWHLGAGHEVVAFEPNPNCHDYFRQVCQLNGWNPDVLRPYAVGSSAGEAELCFPPGQEWLGTTHPEKLHQTDLALWSRCRVPVITLDAFDPDAETDRLILKIDTEGNELAVLAGAERLLQKCHAILFESWTTDADRGAIFDRLKDHRYAVFAIADAGLNGAALSKQAFLQSQHTNFLASKRTESN